MLEIVAKKDSEINHKEAEWNSEMEKMKQFIENEVRSNELERQNNRRIFSFEGQATFEKQRKEITNLQSALANTQVEVKELKELIQKKCKETIDLQIERGIVIWFMYYH